MHRTLFGVAWIYASVAWPMASHAQTPLSIIDWLETEESTPAPQTDIADSARQPNIDVRRLDQPRRPVGLVPSSVTGMPVTLWQNSAPETLNRLIAQTSVSGHTALQSLLYSLLLTEALPPDADQTGAATLIARVDRLLALGAIDPAKALIEEVGPQQDVTLFARWADTAFLTGQEDQLCARLAATPALSPNAETLIFCTARRGQHGRATLLFDAHAALGELDPEVAPALDRFLHPEVFEDAAPLPQPRLPSALLFRLYEAIGERLPTASIPRAFAVADLRDIAGWKAQLEAADRLARTGAIPSNTLLGLYSERRPAASGGVWDRVAALQRFETALSTGSSDAIGKTFPTVWTEMAEAGLLVALADLFAEALVASVVNNEGDTHDALRLALLSQGYESLSKQITPTTAQERFWRALARGTPETESATSPLERAVQAGFDAPQAPSRDLDRARIGESILRAMALFDRGAAGNLNDLTQALQMLRALGLEDVARRASLQLLIIEEG